MFAVVFEKFNGSDWLNVKEESRSTDFHGTRFYPPLLFLDSLKSEAMESCISGEEGSELSMGAADPSDSLSSPHVASASKVPALLGVSVSVLSGDS